MQLKEEEKNIFLKVHLHPRICKIIRNPEKIIFSYMLFLSKILILNENALQSASIIKIMPKILFRCKKSKKIKLLNFEFNFSIK